MFSAVYVIHILICLGIIGLVLIQQGKGAEAGAIFGSSSDSVLGPGSAPSFITKVTTSMAIAFMLTSILLVKAYSGQGALTPAPEDELENSVINEAAVVATATPTVAPTVVPTVAPAVVEQEGTAAISEEEISEEKEVAEENTDVKVITTEAEEPKAETATESEALDKE